LENITNNKQQISNPEEWVDKYGNYLYKIALLRTNNIHQAEDMVQETFMAAFRGKETFKGESTEKTWMVGILKRKIIDHFRKNIKYVGVDQETFEEISGHFQKEGAMKGSWNENAGPGKWDMSPENVLENEEFMQIMQICFGNMPDKLSSVFSLKEIDGWKTEKICKEFDISPSNLWVILHRARLLLRSCLEKKWFKPEMKGI